MKTALVLTTINVPRVLALYRAYGPDVHFFVIGDRKSDDLAITNFLIDIPNHSYYGIDLQHSMYPKLSHLIGENRIQRRNIGFLEALKWGADVVVSIDDDNYPVDENYFNDIAKLFSKPFYGLSVSSASGWHSQYENFKHRGFPLGVETNKTVAPCCDVQVGAIAGFCMGDPDIDVHTRIVLAPRVECANEMLQSGYVIDPNTRIVFNSQNTAVARSCMAAFFMAPGLGRYDDITASLLVQKIARMQNTRVFVGKPFTYQERHAPTPVKDMDLERWGFEHLYKIAEFIDAIPENASPVAAVQFYYEKCDLLPDTARSAGLAWVSVLETVL